MLEGDVAVPGSVANLGGGFDTLGVAVQLYLRVRIVDVRDDGGARLVVTQQPPPVNGAQRGRAGVRPLIAERTGRSAPTVFVEVESDIPMAAGLGSSAAATVAGLADLRARDTDRCPTASCWRRRPRSRATPTTRRRRCLAA